MKEHKKIPKNEPSKVTKIMIIKSEKKPSKVIKGPQKVKYAHTSMKNTYQSDSKSSKVTHNKNISKSNKNTSGITKRPKTLKKSHKVTQRKKQAPYSQTSLTVLEKCQCNIRTMRVKFKAVRVRERRYKVPKKLHFIWIGTEIQDEYLENIEKYVEQNPTYKVCSVTLSLWLYIVL